MKARMKSPTKDAIIPASRPFFLAGSGVMPSAVIHGLANRAGEYHTAPRTHRMTADTRTARRLKWCRCGIRDLRQADVEFNAGSATTKGRVPMWGTAERVSRGIAGRPVHL